MQAIAYDINKSECLFDARDNSPARSVYMGGMRFHVPVLVPEIIKHLNVKSTGVYADCTLGQGGESQTPPSNCSCGRATACPPSFVVQPS